MNFGNDIWIRVIAILEMIGGVAGILFVTYMVIASSFDVGLMMFLPIPLGIFVLSLAAGIFLWKKSEFGRKASIAVQIIQLPKLISPLFTFMFSFGFDLYPHISVINGLSVIGIEFKALADSQIFFNLENAPYRVGISLTAIFALIKLWNYDPKEIDPTPSTGEIPPAPNEYFSENSEPLK